MYPAAQPLAEVLLHGEESDAIVSAIHIVVPPHNAGPPLHAHDFDEAFYVLEGDLTFQVDDAIMAKSAGELCFAPRNTPHALANHGSAPAQYLLICTPAGFERHWARIAAERAGTEPPQWALQPVPQIRVLGPPIPSSESHGSGKRDP